MRTTEQMFGMQPPGGKRPWRLHQTILVCVAHPPGNAKATPAADKGDRPAASAPEVLRFEAHGRAYAAAAVIDQQPTAPAPRRPGRGPGAISAAAVAQRRLGRGNSAAAVVAGVARGAPRDILDEHDPGRAHRRVLCQTAPLHSHHGRFRLQSDRSQPARLLPV